MTDLEKEDLNRILSLCDAFIVPGGYRLYEYDYYICKYALSNNIPILGICAGMQAMAKTDCENKNVLIDENNSHCVESLYCHDIKINKDSLLYKIIGKETIKVNSYHKYKIEHEGINKISATSIDGNVIEGIENNSVKFYLGVQWHPEKLIDIDENSKKLFKYFINRAKKND
jgi:putative glutamine amidotransferase